MKLNFDTPSDGARIEILPLIDVIFCILTFFILGAVSLTRQSAIGVDLPSATTGAPQMRETLLVSLDPIGQLYFEQNPVSRTQLTELLVQERLANPRKLVVLYASRSARYDDVVDVLDLLRQEVGTDRVALATLPEPSELLDPDNTVPTFPGSGPNDLDDTFPTFPGLDGNIDFDNSDFDNSDFDDSNESDSANELDPNLLQPDFTPLESENDASAD
ncbi:MAG: biopolymer transporter ExbD [Cyanothece sp. SIO2G6]|nr:biopolymer transporter ExbD [Cyanothece sp. SIO2G6]